MSKTPAEAWVEALTARGITVALRNGRLAYAPKSAYGSLTDADRAVLREHRAAIINVVREHHGGLARPASWASAATEPLVTATAASVAPKPAPDCRFCMRPCIGPEHALFDVLHADDPAAYWLFRERLREKDNRDFEMRRRYGLTPYRW